MRKNEILELIETKYKDLYGWLDAHPDDLWDKGPDGKWTTGQHIVHLIQSAKPLNKGLKMPSILLKWKFGKSNRIPRDYNTVVHNYRTKLAKVDNPVSPLSRNMPDTPPSGKKDLISELDDHKESLMKIVKKMSDGKLDTCLLPHPLMGRMPLRELVMWSAYHVEHHQSVLEDKYT